jgi:peptide deformylase
MILPIFIYGLPVLRQKALPVQENHPGLNQLILNMFETMYNASGVGLAAPQIGKALRLFVVDGKPMDESEEEGGEEMMDFKKVFINPEILNETGEEWAFEEGCLSIPGIREEVYRKETLTIRYQDETWTTQTETFSGIKARIIQHEYDHIEGILFTDHLSVLKKQILRARMLRLSKGEVNASYPIRISGK